MEKLKDYLLCERSSSQDVIDPVEFDCEVTFDTEWEEDFDIEGEILDEDGEWKSYENTWAQMCIKALDGDDNELDSSSFDIKFCSEDGPSDTIVVTMIPWGPAKNTPLHDFCQYWDLDEDDVYDELVRGKVDDQLDQYDIITTHRY